MLLYVCIGLAVAVVAQSLVIVRVSRALNSVGRFGDRIAHLAAALELLTDTTEAGLGNVAVALEAQRRPTCRPRHPRRDVAPHHHRRPPRRIDSRNCGQRSAVRERSAVAHDARRARQEAVNGALRG